jgi:hypothetical protein
MLEIQVVPIRLISQEQKEFLQDKVGKLEQQLIDLRQPLDRQKPYGRVRSQREMGDIHQQRLGQIRRIAGTLQILRSDQEGVQINFIKSEKGEIVGFSVKQSPEKKV